MLALCEALPAEEVREKFYDRYVINSWDKNVQKAIREHLTVVIGGRLIHL